jgi:DinB superfamily
MSTAATKTSPEGLTAAVLARTLEEGYGPGAWHGPDLKAALEDVDSESAYWKLMPTRHSIAEIAVHHAYHLHNVHSRLTGEPASPFLLAGEDWFVLPSASDLSWPQIRALVESGQKRVSEVLQGIGEGTIKSPLGESEQFDIVLGITAHAIYHAGQIQLLKRFKAERSVQ